MDRNEYNRRLRLEVQVLKALYRPDNSAFLIWFLKNIYCLNEQDYVDSVCDGRNDKGIDGIWVDEESEEIFVFQSEFSPNDDRDAGDVKIREFQGVSAWFESEASVNDLSVSLGNIELKTLLNNLKIGEKIARGYKVNLVYLTNKVFDVNATEYLKNTTIEAYDNKIIFEKYTYLAEDDVANSPKTLDLTNSLGISYSTAVDYPTVVLAIPAKELLKLDGIQDYSLFSRNVRLWVGKTRVNKGISDTLNHVDEHSKFFLYHNGVSIICDRFDYRPDDNEITIEGYQVINGCQSIVSLYQNRSSLSDSVFLLTKIIQVESQHPLIQEITQNANNQNSISQKDLKSNDRVQIALQQQFVEFFDGEVLYRIKKGESAEGYNQTIELDLAAQLVTAFYIRKPHRTPYKSQFYGESYERIFSRNLTCQKIYLAFVVFSTILENLDKIENLKVRGYGAARFCILRIFGSIMADDKLGVEIIENPNEYVRGENLVRLKASLKRLFELISLDVNDFISEFIRENEFFDYKNLFKSQPFVDLMNQNILNAQKKAIIRHKEDSFSEIFANQNADEESPAQT